jgi:hypothetical protein
MLPTHAANGGSAWTYVQTFLKMHVSPGKFGVCVQPSVPNLDFM